MREIKTVMQFTNGDIVAKRVDENVVLSIGTHNDSATIFLDVKELSNLRRVLGDLELMFFEEKS